MNANADPTEPTGISTLSSVFNPPPSQHPLDAYKSVPIQLHEDLLCYGEMFSYYTRRTELVKALHQRLFWTNGIRFLHVRSPSMSGKTAVSRLLHNYIIETNSNAIVIYLHAAEISPNKTFDDYFLKQVGCSFSDFLDWKRERVLLFDEAQTTFDDTYLWNHRLKALLDGRFPGFYFVAFSSHGSMNVNLEKARVTSFSIPSRSIFRLFPSKENPGLLASRDELEEMVKNTILEGKTELIWIMSTGHIGIARRMIDFVVSKLGNKPKEDITEAFVDSQVRSTEMIRYIMECSRGIPTLKAVDNIVRTYESEYPTIRTKIESVMDRIAMGISERNPPSNRPRSAESQKIVDILVKQGFVHEDMHGNLLLPSQIHLKIWLYSRQFDKNPLSLHPGGCVDLLVASIQRMRSANLAAYAQANTTCHARERQIQMELYMAAYSCVTDDIIVYPEWNVKNNQGCVDMRIQGNNFTWYWELLVDGDRAEEHEKRFSLGGKYYDDVNGVDYVLVDFRQRTKEVKKCREGFLYVQFDQDYKTAYLKMSNRVWQTVALK